MSNGNEITIKTRTIGPHTEVQGYIGTHEIMRMRRQSKGDWIVGSSSCLPADAGRAALYVECMRRVFEHAREREQTPNESDQR